MHEKRAHKRVYFTSDTEVIGIFHPVDAPENSFLGRILNLSLGGLFVSIHEDTKMTMKPNDLLVLNGIRSNDFVNFTTNIILEVRWCHGQGVVSYIGCGCQFIEIADAGLQQVRKLLEWGELMAAE